MEEQVSRNGGPNGGSDVLAPCPYNCCLVSWELPWGVGLPNAQDHLILTTILGGSQVFILEMKKLRQPEVSKQQSGFSSPDLFW